MRAFIDKKLTLTSKEGNRVLLIADLGVFPRFQERYPESFINCGCREAVMIDVALGLALAGKDVFIYSVAGFLIHKAYDAIKEARSVLINAEGSITIYNAGAGFVYSEAGEGHYILDDIALMDETSSLHLPSSIEELDEAIDEGVTPGGFTFIRGGFDGAPLKTEKIYKQKQVVTTGTLFQKVKKVIVDNGLDVGVEVLPNSFPKYLDRDFIVIEDHKRQGGVRSVLESFDLNIIGHLHAPEKVPYISRDKELIFKSVGLGEKEILKFLREILNEKNN